MAYAALLHSRQHDPGRRPAAGEAPGAPPAAPAQQAHTVAEVLAQSQADAVMDELERDLVGWRRSRRASAISRRCW